MGYLFLFLALVLNAIANILMKLGSNSLHYFSELSFYQALLKNYILLIGVGLFALNVIFYVLALSKINLSIAYPIMVGGGFLIISLTSFFYFKESIDTLQIMGMILLLIGITLISLAARS